MMTEGNTLTPRQKISEALSAQYERQRQAQALRNLFIAEIKAHPVDGVAKYMKVKDGKTINISAEELAFYKMLGLGDLFCLLDDGLEENMKIAKITEKQRYIHTKAAESYENAQKKMQQLVEARKMLEGWQREPIITDWKGRPWRPKNNKQNGGNHHV